MKFAFLARVTVECNVITEAETEQDAWALVLDGKHEVQLSEFKPVRKPIYKRTPELDQGGYDL